HPRRARRRHQRTVLVSRSGADRRRSEDAHPLPQAPRRLRLSVLQFDPQPHRPRERRPRHGHRRRSDVPRGGLGARRARAAPRSLPCAALGRRATARRHRPRRGEAPRAPALRRAHRSPRLPHRCPRSGGPAEDQPRARDDDGHHHPQRADRAPRRPRDHPRRRTHRWGGAPHREGRRPRADLVKALDRKLLRDLRHLGGQILTIALVVACGVASFVALRGNYASLELARTTYYERYGFAAAFASLERAPRSLLADIEAIPGVARAEGRIVEGVLVPLEPGVRPISGRVVSVPPHGASLNRVDLRQGRLLEPGRNDEILLLEGFALARGIEPGHRLPIVLNGRRREMRVVGLVASPEYVFAVAPGDLAADPTRFAVMWMGEEAVAAAFAMEGAFNDVAVTLQPGASERAVLHELDLRLEPYGGLGAYPRARQPSNYMVSGELTQLRSMSSVVPAIFLAVAALLLNLVLSRLVLLQRGEIAALKALGYHSGEIGLHFAKLVVLIALAGAGLGAAAGAWLGAAMTELYQHYFKFPNLEFRFDLSSAIGSLLVTLLASGIGTFAAVRGVLRLAPAEAMQAPPPARYTRSWLDRLELGRLVGTAPQMVLRELRRRPLRTLLSSVAIASSVGLTVVGGFYYDATEELVRTQFFDVMREDVTVTL